MEELAELSEISPSYMGLLERAERTPSLDTLYGIAYALGTTADELIRETDTVNQEDISNFRKKLNAYLSRLNDKQLKQLIGIVKAAFFYK